MVKGLDRELDRNRNDFGVLHDNTHVDSLLNLRRALRRELDLYAPPEYAQAREAWSGPSAVKEAIGQGRDFSTKDPEEIAAYVKRMKPAVRDVKASWSLLRKAAVPALAIALATKSVNALVAGVVPFTLQTPST
jgi:hypothetical protein